MYKNALRCNREYWLLDIQVAIGWCVNRTRLQEETNGENDAKLVGPNYG